MSRRPDGALEGDVMRVLWRAGRPLQPAEVNELLDQGLAYTTVATILGRLLAKGLVDRAEAGRGYAYAAAVPEAALAGRRIAEVLETAADRREALSWFVGSLSAKDARALRGLLDGLDTT
jgi:predicted transcriptional regulator